MLNIQNCTYETRVELTILLSFSVVFVHGYTNGEASSQCSFELAKARILLFKWRMEVNNYIDLLSHKNIQDLSHTLLVELDKARTGDAVRFPCPSRFEAVVLTFKLAGTSPLNIHCP